MANLTSLGPVLDADVRFLILGSFPSAKSLAAGEYYANPLNQFWRLVGSVMGQNLVGLEYTARTETLLSHHIGLWDVIAACDREGSLDSSIRNARANDFSELRRLAPKLDRVGFNGKKAGKWEQCFAAQYETLVLPSSSPANTVALAQKLKAWRLLIESR